MTGLPAVAAASTTIIDRVVTLLAVMTSGWMRPCWSGMPIGWSLSRSTGGPPSASMLNRHADHVEQGKDTMTPRQLRWLGIAFGTDNNFEALLRECIA